MRDDVVLSNLKFLVEIFGSLRGSRALVDPRGLAACDCGTDEAYENYALLTPGARNIDELVSKCARFFAASRRPFIWPLFPNAFETPDALSEARRLIEESGAKLDDTFFAMEANVSGRDIPNAEGDSLQGVWLAGAEAAEWADAVWQGFDSTEPVPDKFVKFAGEAAQKDEISLFGLRSKRDGTMASTGLLCSDGDTAGAYYVSTRSEYRRRGLGLLVMGALLDRAEAIGCAKTSLLATSAGRPLYLNCGFREIDKVTIMKQEANLGITR
ncbi:MAG: GNAT family N-acetyltransferase [Synergistaceae bacterium]|jgi:GNAT superfamily N-acetyltransferase|nr:GNAT family N-acetyltransferase [Synergistaceae bacterium]